MNKESLQKTIKTKKVWFYSRSKKRLWMKGEESKNYLYLKDILFDCDRDALLVKVKPAGPTCHLNIESCFDAYKGKKDKTVDIGIIAELFDIISKRKKDMPAKSYTASLFREGNKKICVKVMEEAEEVCRAAKIETKQRLTEESVDVLYHLMVLLVENGVSLDRILDEIQKRRK
jgi:phosphoribosyl-ATP pyrophosphohydrolase/phosphoribosyl-AMP cyclohydrolase